MSFLTGVLVADLVGVLVSLLAVLLAYLQWNALHWKRKNIPYIKPRLPVGGRSHIVFSIVREAKAKGWRDYFGMFFSAKPFFVPLDLDIVKCILTKDFNHFTDRGVYYNEKDDPLSAHLFNVANPKWRRLRTKLTPTFTSGKMRGMFQTLVDCGSLLEQALKEHPSKEPIDIKYTLACYSMDIIGSCAFGLECNSFKQPNSPFIKFGRKVVKQTFFQRVKFFLSISFPKLALAFHARAVPADVSNFYYDVVSKTVNYREKSNYSRKDMLQLLIDIKNGKIQTADDKVDGTSLTMDELVAQCFVFFLAGFETSSSTVTFTLFELSRNADIQDKLREELLKVLKKYNKISYDALKEMEYMQQVLDETLRIYPAVPFITRECVLEYKIPNTDIVLKKGDGVIIPIKNIHYDENIYENPEKFDPDRFSAEQKQNRHQYAHLPFGEGPRNCIGQIYVHRTVSKNLVSTFGSKHRVMHEPLHLPMPEPVLKHVCWNTVGKQVPCAAVFTLMDGSSFLLFGVILSKSFAVARLVARMRFGLMQSKVALATILSKFRVKLSSKTKVPLEMDPSSFVPNTKGGIWLELEEI